jgi:TusA-related sulfurtransferase
VEGPRHFDLVRAPFNCRIRSVNERLRAEPKLINRDPYGQGWFATIENLGGPTSLRPLPDVVDALRAKLKDLAVKCFAEFPDQEMYEIGVECSVVLVKLSDLVRRSPSGTVIHLVTDDPTSDIEMERWRAETGNSILDSRREANLYHFVVKKR